MVEVFIQLTEHDFLINAHLQELERLLVSLYYGEHTIAQPQSEYVRLQYTPRFGDYLANLH